MTTDQPDVEIDELPWNVYDAGAKSMEDSGGNDQEVNEAKAALHSMLIEAENRGRATCDIAEDQPNDVHIRYFNLGVKNGRQRALEELWNAHTPDVVPRGWEPDNPVLKDIQAELTNKQEGEQ